MRVDLQVARVEEQACLRERDVSSAGPEWPLGRQQRARRHQVDAQPAQSRVGLQRPGERGGDQR